MTDWQETDLFYIHKGEQRSIQWHAARVRPTSSRFAAGSGLMGKKDQDEYAEELLASGNKSKEPEGLMEPYSEYGNNFIPLFDVRSMKSSSISRVNEVKPVDIVSSFNKALAKLDNMPLNTSSIVASYDPRAIEGNNENDTTENQDFLIPKPKYTPRQTQHGVITETPARDWYIEKTRAKVKEVGMLIPKWDIRIGSSPDGLVEIVYPNPEYISDCEEDIQEYSNSDTYANSNRSFGGGEGINERNEENEDLGQVVRPTITEEGLLEIKCPERPYWPLDQHMIKINEGFKPPPLYHDHIYSRHYCQMQGTEAITQRSWCDYVVYCNVAPYNCVYNERLPFNQDFWNQVYIGLKEFMKTRLYSLPIRIPDTRLGDGGSIVKTIAEIAENYAQIPYPY